MTDRNDRPLDISLGRRDALARLAGVALSFTGLTAFRRFTPAARPAASSRAPKWDDRFELAVDLDVAPQEGFRTHRPYFAVWVEDTAGRPVRTLSLSVNTSGRGPRYIHELRRWFTMARDEQDAGGPDLVATVSSATRLPGRYSVTWDGRDDRGNVVDQGTYRVFIEAAREHGTYQLMQQDLTLAAKPVAADLPGNEEIGRARVEYRRRK
jgi:thiamine biosynthesis lipoprotein